MRQFRKHGFGARFFGAGHMPILLALALLCMAAAASGCGGGGTPATGAKATAAAAVETAAAAETETATAAETTKAADETAETAVKTEDAILYGETDAAGGAEGDNAETGGAEGVNAADVAGDGAPGAALPRDQFLSATTQATAPTGAAVQAAAGTQLNLFTWEGMFPQDILDKFERDYGVRINYVNFDFDETMLSKLEAAQGGDYDLVIADDYIIELVIQAGLAQKLDKSKIKNFGNIDPIFQGQFYDPNDEYTVPYGAGVQTIVYDPSAVDFEITGYADLWNPSLKDSVGIIANYRVINGMALKVLGKSYNTENLDDIRAAGDKLVGLAPNIRLIKDDQLQDDLISGEISAAVMYTSQVFESVMENPELRVVFPKEGIGFGVMAGFIPSKAPNPDAAYLFLDYILNEQISAGCFVELGYYSTNKASDKYFAPAVRDLLILPEGFNTEMEMIGNIGEEASAEHDLVWTKFKTAAGQ